MIYLGEHAGALSLVADDLRHETWEGFSSEEVSFYKDQAIQLAEQLEK